jgi:hypothetical protein
MKEVISLLPLKCVIISLLIVVLAFYLMWKTDKSDNEAIQWVGGFLAIAMELAILFLYFRDLTLWLSQH